MTSPGVVDPASLIRDANLSCGGQVEWSEKVPCRDPGIYIIWIDDPASIDVTGLPSGDRQFWLNDQVIVYIGRSIQVSRRLDQFYKHKYGAKKPHAGGQAILNLAVPKHVLWAAVDDYAAAEDALIREFEKRVGHKPFGNRSKSAQMKKTIS